VNGRVAGGGGVVPGLTASCRDFTPRRRNCAVLKLLVLDSQIFDYRPDPDSLFVEHFTVGDAFDNTMEPS